MQQQMPHQHQQLGPHQQNQQMLLCPVRLVYETQILVQPGDQIHPNQTIFINPHNPPPWIQNRQAQNQVIYVQQMPNNMQPTQEMNQQQMYIQSFPNYQQIPQQMIQQNQQIQLQASPIQIPMQNVNQNVQRITNDRTVQTFEPMPSNIGVNITNQSQMIAPNNRQVITNTPQSLVQYNTPQKTVEVQNTRQVIYKNIGQQQFTQVSQVMNMNQIHGPNTQNVQQIAPNVGQTYVSSQVVQGSNRNMPNILPVNTSEANNIQMGNVRQTVNTNMINPVPRNYGQRVISRPQRQFRPNLPITATITAPTQQYVTMPNVVNTSNIGPNIPNTGPRFNVAPINNPVEAAQNNLNNRKRKSESPDENKRKVASVAQETPHEMSKITPIINKTHEMGVNTAPVSYIRENVTKNVSTGAQTDISARLIAKIQNNAIQNTKEASPVKSNTANLPTDIKNQSTNTDKLIRNTVFTQVRGRICTDKFNIINTTQPDKMNQTNQIEEINNINNAIEKIENTNTEVENETKKIAEFTIKKLPNKVEASETRNSMDDLKDKEKALTDGNVPTDEKDNFILTHVLDGFVIQESNQAFPIRKPLREKEIQPNTQTVKGLNKDRKPDNKQEDEVKVPSIQDLQLSEATDHSSEKSNCPGNPFEDVKPASVKSWTIDQMCAHLAKHNWKETISILREHEIDGESLFLVSKPQLLTIGVDEGHADIICGFIKS